MALGWTVRRSLDSEHPLEGGPRDKDATPDPDVGDLVARHGLVSEGPADAEGRGGLLNGHGESLLTA